VDAVFPQFQKISIMHLDGSAESAYEVKPLGNSRCKWALVWKAEKKGKKREQQQRLKGF